MDHYNPDVAILSSEPVLELSSTIIPAARYSERPWGILAGVLTPFMTTFLKIDDPRTVHGSQLKVAHGRGEAISACY
jgi:hypothetical protein